MTISSTTRSAGPFEGNGTGTVFPFAFKVFTAADLLVARTDTADLQTLLVLDVDYTVTLNTDQNTAPGGNITLTAPLASGYLLYATSNVAVLQTLSLTQNSGFYPSAIEDALDKITVLIQQQGYTSLGQTLRVPEVSGTTVLPTASARADKLLAFDEFGQPVVVVPSSGSAADLALELLSTTDADKGAGQVAYKGGLDYALATSGHKLAAFSTLVDDFDAVGDGVTADNVAILAALNSGKAIDGQGLTYKLTTPLVVTPGVAPKLTHCALDISEMSADAAAYAITVGGSQGTKIDFASDTAAVDLTATLASVDGLSIDQYVWLESDVVWDVASATCVAFIAQIRAIDTGTKVVTFHEQLPYSLTTVSSVKPRLYPLEMLAGVVFDRVKIIGLPMTAPGLPADRYEVGIKLDKCLDPIVRDVVCQDVNCAGVVFYRCIGGRRWGGGHLRARATGLAYGTVIAGGCLGVSVIGTRTEDVRHGATIGDNDGINQHSIIACNQFLNCRDAGSDSHAASDYESVVNNIITISSQCDGSTTIGDGIISQAPNFHCVGNIVTNPARCGIFHQLLANQGGTATIVGNTVRMSNAVASEAGIHVVNQTGGAALLAGVTIDGNTIRGAGAYAIYVRSYLGSITGVTIGPNECSQFTASVEALTLRASGMTVDKVSITGGSYVTSGTRCVRAFADGEGTISNVKVSGVQADGGTYAYSLVDIANVDADALSYINSTKKFEWSGNTNGKVDGRFIGSATYNPSSLADGAGATTTVTVTGAALGDLATASFSLDLQGVTLTAWVSAANTVSVRFQNGSGGTLDLASGTLRAFVEPAPA